MTIQIREAHAGDCPRMLELIRELATFERAPSQVTVTPEHFSESGFGKNPVWWALVATVSDDPVHQKEFIAGFALYYIRYSTWKGQRMYLEDILVTEEYRGRGIGRMLFEKLVQVAGEKGFEAIAWQVLDWNERAIQFYSRYGAQYDKGWLNAWIPIH